MADPHAKNAKSNPALLLRMPKVPRQALLAVCAALLPLLAGCVSSPPSGPSSNGDGAIDDGDAGPGGSAQAVASCPEASETGRPLSKGQVTVRREGGKYRAERTDSGSLQIPRGLPVASRLGSVNGDVQQASGSSQGLVAHLWARGDTEQEARARLDTVRVDFTADAGSVFTLTAMVRTSNPSSNAWSERGGSLAATVPSGTAFCNAKLTTTNGDASSHALAVAARETTTTNGDVEATGAVPSWTGRTTNGDADGDLTASASGWIDLSTTNGEVDVTLRLAASHGIDATASTTNGDATLSFAGASPIGSQSETSAHVRTSDYSAKAVQTELKLRSTNGDVTAGDG